MDTSNYFFTSPNLTDMDFITNTVQGIINATAFKY